MFNACSSLGFIFGPLISGYLADRDPSLQLSVITGAGVIGVNSLLVGFLVPSLLTTIQNQESISSPSLESDKLASWTSLKHVLDSVNIFKGTETYWWKLWEIITIQFLLTFSIIIFKNSFVISMEEQFHISSSTLGKILSFNGLTSALSSATAGRISRFYSKNNIKQVLHFTLLLAVSLTCLSFAPNVLCVLVLLVPISLSTANLRICLLSLMLQRGKEEEKGAIVGLSSSISSISRMLAPTIVGVSQEYSVGLPGYLSAILAVGAAGVALSCYCYLQTRPTSVEVDDNY